MSDLGRPKTGLVLSAGGMFGAYQAGAWEVLAQCFRPDVVIGVSVGALNAWAIAGGVDPERLSQAWLDPSCGSLTKLRPTLRLWRGLLDGQALHDRIRALWESFRPRAEIGVVAVELRRLRPRLFRNEEIGWEHLAASCALLCCYPQIRIGGALFTDGGLLGALPLWAAPQMGVRTIVAVNVLPQPISSVLRAALRTIRRFASAPPSLPPEVKVIEIAPDRPLGSLRDSLFWDREAAARWITQGRLDAAARSDALEILSRAQR